MILWFQVLSCLHCCAADLESQTQTGSTNTASKPVTSLKSSWHFHIQSSNILRSDYSILSKMIILCIFLKGQTCKMLLLFVLCTYCYKQNFPKVLGKFGLGRHMDICGLLEVFIQGSAVILQFLLARRQRKQSCCWVVVLVRLPLCSLVYWPVSC